MVLQCKFEDVGHFIYVCAFLDLEQDKLLPSHAGGNFTLLQEYLLKVFYRLSHDTGPLGLFSFFLCFRC